MAPSLLAKNKRHSVQRLLRLLRLLHNRAYRSRTSLLSSFKPQPFQILQPLLQVQYELAYRLFRTRTPYETVCAIEADRADRVYFPGPVPF